ncbi:hypothetical protein LTR53_000346 [Teratosphaeriaceae sp. CCFEE 6253]|nr:hypothetical protein LTR53_000346 [Teratosphaeriaceae sp. CCFEE 6253]
MERSWFSKATARKYGLVADSQLPRWRSPSPMAASMIPPPIVQSTYAVSPAVAQQSALLERPPQPTNDRQSEIEADLQYLLDAQAEGLVQGLEGGAGDDHGSTGSTTPTAQSVRSSSAKRRTRPLRKRPGLRSARKGIHNSILALSAVKTEELQAIDAGAREQEAMLSQIDEWEQKRHGLEAAARHVDESEDTVRSQRLRQEADVLQSEINTVELQLADLKARQRKLLRHAAAAENEVQAKLASYTSSLSLLEEDVRKFLASQPAPSDTRPPSQDGGKSLWRLPSKRRTLGMAREQYTADRDVVLKQREAIEHEQGALEEGAAVWKDVISRVTEFERCMRASMTSLPSPQSPWDEEASPSSSNEGQLQKLLGQLGDVQGHLDSQLKLAEANDWKLLIAAIGAEADALRQGRQILENVLGITSNEEGARDLVDAAEPTNGSAASSISNGGDEIHELDRSFETARPPRRHASDSEDDPDPELLFSRQDE